MKFFIEPIHFLLKKVDSLLFMPHVTMPVDNDEEALLNLQQNLTLKEQTRICWASHSLNAAQRKYLISQCKMLICCRTHASIAGYSTDVPTLVVGYSVKSQGIGRDLGMERWVVPAEQGEILPDLVSDLWSQRANVLCNLKQNCRELITQLNSGGGIPIG